MKDDVLLIDRALKAFADIANSLTHGANTTKGSRNIHPHYPHPVDTEIPLWIGCARIETQIWVSAGEMDVQNLSLDLSPACQQDCQP